MHNLPDLWTQLYAAAQYPRPLPRSTRGRLQTIAEIRYPTVAHLHAIGWVVGEAHERKDGCLPSDITAVALVDWKEAE